MLHTERLVINKETFYIQTSIDIQDIQILALPLVTFDENSIVNRFDALFTSLHALRLNDGVYPILLAGIHSNAGTISYFLGAQGQLVPSLKQVIVGNLGIADFTVGNYQSIVKGSGVESTGSPQYISVVEAKLQSDFLLPLRTRLDRDQSDPIVPLLSVLQKLKKQQQVTFQFVFRPFPPIWQEFGKEALSHLYRTGKLPAFEVFDYSGNLLLNFMKFSGKLLAEIKRLALTPEEEERSFPKGRDDPFMRELTFQIKEKLLSVGFQTRILITIRAASQSDVGVIVNQLQAVFKHFSHPPFNGFRFEYVESSEGRVGFKLPKDNTQILTAREVSNIFHYPYVGDGTVLNIRKATPLPPPQNLPVQKGLLFGWTNYKGVRYVFGIEPESKLRHLYILGKSGTGKSTILKNLAIGDIARGNGVCIIDPHGDLVEELLDFIPEERIEDVVYFNVTDTAYPIGFNPVHLKPEEEELMDVVADGILAVFKKQFQHSWGPRLEYILYNAILAVLASQGTTLLSIQKMLVDHNYRKRVLSHIKDPGVLYFWRSEFQQLTQNKQFYTQVISSIQNKVGRFLAPRVIRNILGQTRSAFNLRKVIDEQKILLVNLSKGRIGEENASLLGSLLITRVYSSALQQARIPYEQRRYFGLYIDEVQSFATDVFPNILSEARKYKLSLTMAHQFLNQLPLNIIDAVFGNVANMIILNVGNNDAQRLEREFGPYLKATDFVNLTQYQMYVRMLIGNKMVPPFSAYSLPVIYRRQGHKDRIVQFSRSHYATPVEKIEERLARWLVT